MNTMIPNPSRTITISKPVAYVMERLKHIGAWTGNDTGITIVQANIDTTLNTYQFKSKANIFGFADMGNNGFVTVTPVNDASCTLSIEMGKNFGSISDQYEAQDCMSQINAFLNVLSSVLNMDMDQITKYPKQKKKVDASPITTHSWKTIGIIWGIVFLLAMIVAAL